MAPEQATQGWPKLRNVLNSISPKIASFNVRPAMDEHKAILRFTNNYGVEIFKHASDEFFEMTVIRFRGGSYEFAFDTSIPDLNLAYSDEDVLKPCRDVSDLK